MKVINKINERNWKPVKTLVTKAFKNEYTFPVYRTFPFRAKVGGRTVTGLIYRISLSSWGFVVNQDDGRHLWHTSSALNQAATYRPWQLESVNSVELVQIMQQQRLNRAHLLSQPTAPRLKDHFQIEDLEMYY